MAADLPSHPLDASGGGPVVPARTRERAVEVLCAHFAEDNISLDELERRLDMAYAASTTAQLDALTSDLPTLARSPAAETSVAVQPAVAVEPATQVADNDFMLAIMGGVERKGAWVPPRRMTVGRVMGGVELELGEGRR
jgi:hypothetical protein